MFRSFSFDAVEGVFSVTGFSALMLKELKVSLDNASIVLNGSDAALLYGTNQNLQMIGEVKLFTFSGLPALLQRSTVTTDKGPRIGYDHMADVPLSINRSVRSDTGALQVMMI